MTEPFPGPDGTQAPEGTDALAPLPRGVDEPLPALPVLPLAGDEAAVARWMDADAAAARRATDPSAATTARVDGAVVDAGEARDERVREAGQPRLLPRDVRPRPAPASGPERHGPDGPTLDGQTAEAEEPEPEWVRERREEHEFRSQFGEWRPGARPATPGRSLGPVTLLVLLALVVLVAVVAMA